MISSRSSGPSRSSMSSRLTGAAERLRSAAQSKAAQLRSAASGMGARLRGAAGSIGSAGQGAADVAADVGSIGVPAVPDLGEQIRARVDAMMRDAFEGVSRAAPVNLSGSAPVAPVTATQRPVAPTTSLSPTVPTAPAPTTTVEPESEVGTMDPPPSNGLDPRIEFLIDPNGAGRPIAEPTQGTGTTMPTGLPETGVSPEAIQAAKAMNVSPEGLSQNAMYAMERANEYGLHMTGGVGHWNDFHAHGTSVDVSNYTPGQGLTETPEMRAYADEMVELGRSGALGPDGKPLVAYVVYAGKRAGINTGWEWVPVTQPEHVTQGHWDHVHVSTDNAH